MRKRRYGSEKKAVIPDWLLEAEGIPEGERFFMLVFIDLDEKLGNTGFIDIYLKDYTRKMGINRHKMQALLESMEARGLIEVTKGLSKASPTHIKIKYGNWFSDKIPGVDLYPVPPMKTVSETSL